ncbi:PepSY domain-containing protein [Alteromonas sediminis]|nr:PepSY domain-containing protein [Alteromonas sediminis]
MSKINTVIAIAAAIAALVLGPSVAMAQQSDDKKQNKTINQAQAIQQARQRVDGRVLRVDQKNQHYRVKMLQKSGRVVNVDVNRHTGRVVQQTPQPKIKKDN